MKKVVIILTEPIENNTSSMIRCKNIMFALPRIGYEVTCYCPSPDTESVYFDKDDSLLQEICIRRYGGNKPIRVEAKSVAEANSLKKKLIAVLYKLFKKFDVFGASLQYLRFRKQLTREIAKENYDILLTFSDPMTAHMIGCYCKRHINIKYVQQWGDPLTTDIISKTALSPKVRYFIEKSLLQPADRVCYVSPFTCEEQQVIFGNFAHKMVFLPTPCLTYKKFMNVSKDRMQVGYFGSYNLVARDIRPLYKAACEVPECDFFFIGDSDIKLEETGNIRIINRIAPKELESYIEKMDVLVCLMNSKGNQIPGKVYHYAGSYKEILFIKDGEFGEKIEEFFAKYSRYTFVENDCKEIEKTLKQYAKEGVPKREPLGAFNAESIAQELLKGI